MSECRFLYLDYLRFVSIIAVIFIHVTAPSLPMSINDIGWQINIAFNSMGRFGVPVFFMISGALFLNLDRSVSLLYLWGKIRRIIIAFFIFSLIYNAMWYVATTGFSYNYELFIHKFIPNLIGGWYHLWYLQALFVLYILTPILRLIVIDKKITLYTILLLFVICSLFPFINSFLNLNLYTSCMQENMALDLPKFSLFFLLGSFIHSSKESIGKIKILLVGAMSLLIMIISDIFLSAYKGKAIIVFSSYMSPFTVIYSVCLYIFFRNRYNNTIIPQFIITISSLSFGIYLVHDFFLIVAREVKLIPFNEHAYVKIPIMVIVVLMSSTLLTYVLKKTPFIKNVYNRDVICSYVKY